MLLSLITGEELFSLTLPSQVAGRYALYGRCSHAAPLRVLFYVEAVGEEWMLKPTKRTSIVSGSKREGRTDARALQAPALYKVALKGSEAPAFILVEPLSQDRVTFAKYVVEDGARVTIGRSRDNVLAYARSVVSDVHAQLVYRDRTWTARDLGSANGTFVNGKRLPQERDCELHPGDFVWIMGLCVVVCSNFLSVNNPNGLVSADARILRRLVCPSYSDIEQDWEETGDDGERKEFFYRSPRFRRSVEPFELTVDAPPAPPEEDELPLAYTIGPALTMGLAMVFSAVVMAYNTLSGNGSLLSALPMLVMSVTMLLGMVLWPILTKKYQQKKLAEEEMRRQARYREYLDGIRLQIHAECQNQKAIITENNPTTIALMNRVFDKSRSLWERSIGHDDFLSVRLGVGSLEMQAQMGFPKRQFDLVEDNLKDALRILEEEPRRLEDVPISVNLREDNICGIIGKRGDVLRCVRGMVAQLTSLQSYDEFKICLVYDKAEREAWEFLRWLPHAWSNDMSLRFLAGTAQEMRELSLFLEGVIAQRIEEGMKEESYPMPHYLVIAASSELFATTELVDLVSRCECNIGVSILALFDELKYLPKECDDVIRLDGASGTLFKQHDMTGKTTAFTLDPSVGRTDMRRYAVALANIKLDLTEQKDALPKSVTFMDMYGVGKVEHLNSAARWEENNPVVSLAAPIGIAANGELSVLDLHENVHGPHGLIAGMTGSGKSEFIITYLLSMAVNFHPHEVSFILIDYKGGGLAGAFDNERRKLPHVAGTITNLDGAAIDRALVSIQSELRRRQAIFNEAREAANEGTMDIYKYQQLFRAGVVDEPIPHLLIVSDEFAELKQQQPEFMDQLISTARIGRSLGVHLILATQKPSGIVNDQIRSNAKFKICLKVQDKADSMDMINRPEAASLVETGRYYLQVGYNEFFALGQSAWAGAPYVPQERVSSKRDDSVVVVNEMGHAVMQAKPAPKLTSTRKTRQIMAVIDYVSDIANTKHAELKPLWLPPIPESIYVDDLCEKYSWKPAAGKLEACVGELDDPFNQSQRILTVSFDDKGSVIVCGRAGSGKGLFVDAVLYSLLRDYDASRLNLYILDFEGGSSKMYERAPQVGDVVNAENPEKVVNLFRMLARELASRKKRAQTRDAEALLSDFEVPRIVVVLQNVAAFYELFDALEPELVTLTREGGKFGMYFVVTEVASNNMRFRLTQNFGATFALRVNDPNDYAVLLGGKAGKKRFSNVRGRGLAQEADVYEFQSAHPFCRQAYVGSDGPARMVERFCEGLRENGSGASAPSVPVLPDVVTASFMEQHAQSFSKMPVGVAKASLAPAKVDLVRSGAVIWGSADWTLLKSFEAEFLALAQLVPDDRIRAFTVLDPFGKFEADERNPAVPFVSGLDECAVRLEEYLALTEEERNSRALIVNSVATFLGCLDGERQRTAKRFLEAQVSQGGGVVIVCDTASDYNAVAFDAWAQKCASSCPGVWLGNGFAEQRMLKVSAMTNDLYKPIPEGFGYVVAKGKPVLAKLLANEAVLGREDDR